MARDIQCHQQWDKDQLVQTESHLIIHNSLLILGIQDIDIFEFWKKIFLITYFF